MTLSLKPTPLPLASDHSRMVVTVRAGDAVVVRGLPFKRRSRDILPAAIAHVVRVLPDALVITLQFARKPRRCTPENVARVATVREVATGRVIDPLPARAA